VNLFLTASLYSQLSKRAKMIVYTEAIKLIEAYQKNINDIAKLQNIDVKEAESHAEDIIDLFLSRKVLVYNDLDPFHQLSEYYEIETYVSNLILWYPDGMKVLLNPDKIKGSEIKLYGENVYSIDVQADKKNNGNYLNKTLNINKEKLVFRIAFLKKSRLPENFKIVGIRNIASIFNIDNMRSLHDMKSEKIPEDEKEKINQFTSNLLKDYISSLSLIGNPEEPDDEKVFYIESFKNIFSSTDNRVFNDLQPDPDKNLLSIDEYIEVFQTKYQDGIKNIALNLDSAEFGSVISLGEDKYYTNIYTTKFFSGTYQKKNVFSTSQQLIFKILFERMGNTYGNFKIESIDRGDINYYMQDKLERPVTFSAIKKLDRTGYSINGFLMAGQSSIIDNNIKNLTIQEDFHEWTINKDPGFSAGIHINNFLYDKVGLYSGIEVNRFSSKYSLSGNLQDEILSTDINNESYYKIITADYDSVVYITSVSIPVGLKIMNSDPDKIGYYFECNISFSIIASAIYKLSGDYQLQGYYPDHPDVVKYLSIPELGFYTHTNLNKTGNIELKNISLYAGLGFGLSIPAGYFSTICLGPKIFLSLNNNIKKEDDYTNIFGRVENSEGINIRNIGFMISYFYKL
jgi:hypothetical protein